MVTQTNTNDDLLVLCVTYEQRPLVYHENKDLLYPHEKCLCVPTTNPPLSLKFAFLSSLKISDRGCNPCGRLGKQTSGKKKNFSVYDISQPTPSVSLSDPSCSLVTLYIEEPIKLPWKQNLQWEYCKG